MVWTYRNNWVAYIDKTTDRIPNGKLESRRAKAWQSEGIHVRWMEYEWIGIITVTNIWKEKLQEEIINAMHIIL
jgi:hypothetical protein